MIKKLIKLNINSNTQNQNFKLLMNFMKNYNYIIYIIRCKQIQNNLNIFKLFILKSI